MSFVPLYQRVKERIRMDILAAQDEGARLPTERELQARYQVSRPTISKALAELSAEGFLVKMQRRGSFTSLQAPSAVVLTAETPRRIGYVAPVAGEELVQRAFRGSDAVAHRRGFRVLMGNAGNSVAREKEAVTEFVASGVSGLIITPYPRVGEEALHDNLIEERFGIPVVLLDSCVPEQGHTQVIFDNRRAGYDMTNWLLREGHRRIGVVTYPEAIIHAPLANRLSGYQDALRDHSVPFEPSLVRRFEPSLDHVSAMSRILDDLLALPEPPTALIAPEDMTALELSELLSARGVRVPEEITVVGFDNRTSARRFLPPFTTTNPDFERLGEIACSLLLEEIESGEIKPRTRILDVPLLIRTEAQIPAHSRRIMLTTP